jgi:hypothetical protein
MEKMPGKQYFRLKVREDIVRPTKYGFYLKFAGKGKKSSRIAWGPNICI